MKPNFLLLAAVGTLLSFNFLNAQTVVTSDFTTVADGRVQSSGVLGLELFSAEEDIRTLMSGPSNISDGLFEFDLSSLPSDAVVTSVELLFRTAAAISNTSGTAPVEFFGYTGNGTIELSDESAAATSVASAAFPTTFVNGDSVSVPLSNLAIIDSVLTDANTSDFFGIRSETENFVDFRVDSLESTDPNAAPARLRLTYQTAAVPEPSSLAVVGALGLGFIARRRRT